MKPLYRLLALCLLSVSAIAAPPTITLTANPTSSAGATNVALSWNTGGAAACTASATPGNSNWTGAKALTGNQTLPVSVTTTFTLTCATQPDNSALLTALTPTQNTDGTALTDLAGIRFYQFNGTTNLLLGDIAGTVDNANVTLNVTPLTAGVYTFNATAYDSAGNESDHSANATKTILPVESSFANASVMISPKPNAPTLTVR